MYILLGIMKSTSSYDNFNIRVHVKVNMLIYKRKTDLQVLIRNNEMSTTQNHIFFRRKYNNIFQKHKQNNRCRITQIGLYRRPICSFMIEYINNIH